MQNESILFYRLGQSQSGYFIRDPYKEQWANVRYSLVLILDDVGVLKQHSLVDVQ